MKSLVGAYIHPCIFGNTIRRVHSHLWLG